MVDNPTLPQVFPNRSLWFDFPCYRYQSFVNGFVNVVGKMKPKKIGLGKPVVMWE